MRSNLRRRSAWLLLAPTLLLSLSACRAPDRSPTDRPNVLLIVIDTLRADHLGAYGYERNTSPTIDRFAKDNLKFNFANSAAPWTSPSVASIFTGLYPTAHGVIRHYFASEDAVRASVLSEEIVTLAEVFSENGYTTMGLTANAWIAAHLGYAQGFEHFAEKDYSPAQNINREALVLLDAHGDSGAGTPFFLYLHYMDPHPPLLAHPGYEGRITSPLSSRNYSDEILERVNLYDGEISYLDASIGELFDDLKHRGLYDDMAIVLVADHGRQFMEHGIMGHGGALYNTDTHVSLVIKADDRRGEVDEAVSLIDVYPTLFELVGIPLTHPIQGLSLISQLAQRKAEGVFIEIPDELNHKAFLMDSGEKLILEFEDKYIVTEQDEIGVVGLFNSREDYPEQHPITDDALVEQMRRKLYAIYQGSVDLGDQLSQGTVELQDDTLRKLKALGYLN